MIYNYKFNEKHQGKRIAIKIFITNEGRIFRRMDQLQTNSLSHPRRISRTLLQFLEWHQKGYKKNRQPSHLPSDIFPQNKRLLPVLKILVSSRKKSIRKDRQMDKLTSIRDETGSHLAYPLKSPNLFRKINHIQSVNQRYEISAKSIQ